MRFGLIHTVISILCLLFSVSGFAQIIPVENEKEFTDSLKKDLDYGPYFGLYKDNYFTVGTTPVSNYTYDAADEL